MERPGNLRPIPTQPWDERPDELPLDVEEARTAIWENSGNISAAAAMLKVRPSRFRAFVKTNALLQREVDEAAEQLVDIAEQVVKEGLADDDEKYAMARFVLSSKGKSRGWGQGASNTTVSLSNNNIVIAWDNGQPLVGTTEPDVIEGTLADA